MKRSVFLICVILMCLLAACGTQTADPQTEPETEPETTVKVTDPPEEELAGYFKLSDYERELKLFPREENFGPITDIESLLEKTETLWVEVYGRKVKDEKPYQVYFDKESGAWYVHGTFHDPKGNKKGGVHHILVDHETGDVLAVWGNK